MNIGYIVHNLNDPAVERRCVMFDRGGAGVTLAGFCRDVEIASGPARRNPLLLGNSEDAAMAKRAAATLGAALDNGALKQHFAKCNVIMARNLEQLAIASRVAGDRPLVYECLDIHRSLVGKGLGARMVQLVEAGLLPRVDLLLTSSPAFVRNHFAHRPLRAPVELIENKLLVEDGAAPRAVQPEAALPLRIGWFGMLRCRKTFAFLSDLVRRSEGRIEVLICGKPSPAELPTLAEDVSRVPGMSFTGPYHYDDLPRLYGQCHFAWTIDWFEEGLNSSWLLPNRLYEALAHGAIPIALAEIEVGRWLSARGVGLLVDQPEDAAERLLAMSPAEVAELQRKVLGLDRSSLIAARSDCRALVDTVASARHG